MWMATREGFFSVVHDRYCGPGELMVRARCKEDLLALRKRLDIRREIIQVKEADYRFRLPVIRDELANYAYDVVDQIDYGNVKATLTKGDSERAVAYSGMWAAGMAWQDRLEGRPRGQRVKIVPPTLSSRVGWRGETECAGRVR